MEHVHLGRNGLNVSPLCLGTMNFGPHTPEAESFALMDRALEPGINFFDTADVLNNPAVTAPIIGPRTMEPLDGTLRATKIKLAAETLKRLDEIWPGPGGEASKASSW